MTSFNSFAEIFFSRIETAGYPSKCGVVKSARGLLREQDLHLEIGGAHAQDRPGGRVAPRALISEDRSGRSHVKNFLLTIHAALPLAVASSLAPGSASAIRRTSRQVATSLISARHRLTPRERTAK